jgi:aspartate carbamoyltransferase regulatory subunit
MSDKERTTIQVAALENGTVIDHLRPGTALRATKMLGLSGKRVVTIGMYLPSSQMGTKDIMKIADRELTQTEVNKLALLSPLVSVSIIRGYKIVQKLKAVLPDVIEDLMRCQNPGCITQTEKGIHHRLMVLSKVEPVRLQCHYCERRATADELSYL